MNAKNKPSVIHSLIAPYLNNKHVPPSIVKDQPIKITFGLSEGNVVIAFQRAVDHVKFNPEHAAAIASEIMRLAIAGGYSVPGMTIEAALDPGGVEMSGEVGGNIVCGHSREKFL